MDVTTVGATLAYAYTSAAAYTTAKKEGNRRIRITGLAGIVMSGIFFLYFMSWSAGALSTESYLILASWSILGFVYFRFVFAHDTDRKFGKSTVTWICLLFLIFFTSLMWVKQATDDMTKDVVENISEYYEEQNTGRDPETIKKTEEYLAGQMKIADRVLTRNSLIQMLLIMASLVIMLSIYSTVSRREKQMETEKIKAEEGSRAKSAFLSNMSHDIRTSTVSGIQGTGLGMSITKSIIDLMGGTIDLVTSPGRGTEFIIRLALPLQEEIAGRMKKKTKRQSLCAMSLLTPVP
ncbi:MAG: hypothetical protein K6E90_09025 [Lachnospiraceae bacterium]|nr:hypothetical protein [Lachnospiraceae bacterium]